MWESGVVMRWLAAFALFFVSLSSHALLPTGTGYRTTIGYASVISIETRSTYVESCSAAAAGWQTANSRMTVKNAWENQCVTNLISKSTGEVTGNPGFPTETLSGVCPANSTAVTGGCQCNTNYKESGGQCVPDTNPCTANAGKPTTIRVTIGYTRTPDDNDSKAVGPTFNPWNGAPVCSGGCTMNYSGVESAWISQSPNAQGLYRNSVDATYVNSGQQCTASGTNPADQAVNPQAPQPDCPGYVGEVNGKVGCYGTAAKPVTTGTKPTGIPQPPPRAGNPPSGERPASGEGSASNPTPAAGNGGPSGGPAAAGVGGRGGGAGGTASGTGSTTNGEGEEEKDPCGAPGQAVCNVKVDETGTPANGGDGMGTTKLNEVMDKADQGIAKAIDSSTMDTSWGGIPQWFASGGCTPWNLGTLPIINRVIVIDICPVAGYVVAVMSFLWVVGTFFAIIGMVGRVTGAGVH
jgi:hypothetical protein